MPLNPKNTALVTVSVPLPIARQIERTRKRENRSRSELVREALRVYFARADTFPVVHATPAELRALKRARAAYLRGETITLDEYEHTRALDSAPRPNRGKAARPATDPRPRRSPRRASSARQ
jgi:Arc/MetJ-type ribon-helix-helix transcriptional regulator